MEELPRGGYIGQGLLPSLASYESYELEIPWTELPNPEEYALLCDYTNPSTFHICLTAVIDESSLFLSEGLDWSHTQNVLDNNNVVQKNVHLTIKKNLVVVEDAPTQLGAAEIAIYTEGVSDDITFELEDLTGGEIVNNDRVKMRLDPVLMQKWLDGGKQGENIHLAVENTSELYRGMPNDSIEAILDPLETNFIVLDSAQGKIIIPNAPAHHKGLQYLAFHDSLEYDLTGTPLGPALLLNDLINFISSAKKVYVGDFRLTMRSKNKGVVGGNTFQVYGVEGEPVLDLLKNGREGGNPGDLLEYASQLSASGEGNYHIYPNPAHDYLNLKLPTTASEVVEGLSYSIINVLGQEVQTGPIENRLLLDAISNGTYYLVIRKKENIQSVQGFQKR